MTNINLTGDANSDILEFKINGDVIDINSLDKTNIDKFLSILRKSEFSTIVVNTDFELNISLNFSNYKEDNFFVDLLDYDSLSSDDKISIDYLNNITI